MEMTSSLLMKPGLKVILSLIFQINTIARRDRPRRQAGGVAILACNDIKFDIIDPCSTLNTDNEAITILLRNSQDSISISIIYIPPASTISTALLDNIRKTADNIIITGDHIDFNRTK